jgi:hypothetical protein
MGICESSKEKEKIKTKITPPIENDNNNKNNIKNTSINNDEDNLNGVETHPSSNSQENENKVPELIKYDQDHSGKKSEISFVNSRHGSLSSNQKEEELIIRGEINKTNINKEEDFDNMDFKDLIVQSGGIVIKDKDKDKMSNVYSYQGINPAYDFHKEAISEIKSKHSFPFKTTNKSNIHDKLEGRKDNLDLINNRRGGEIDNENNSNLIQNNEERLRDSYKINVSIHDNSLRNDAFLSIPRNDEPFPDMDELSTESPLLRRSSLISD